MRWTVEAYPSVISSNSVSNSVRTGMIRSAFRASGLDRILEDEAYLEAGLEIAVAVTGFWRVRAFFGRADGMLKRYSGKQRGRKEFPLLLLREQGRLLACSLGHRPIS